MDPTFFESPAELRAWFEANHATARELLMGFWKKSVGRADSPTYKDAVDECLCFGWIDGVRRTIDGESYVQRLTPRRKRSNWSLINVNRFQELVAAGRMTPAGVAAFEARTDERTGVYSFEQGEFQLEPTMLDQLRANEAAWTFWEKAAKSYRKLATWWLISAKKDETKSRRLEELIACSALGERVPPFRPLPRKK